MRPARSEQFEAETLASITGLDIGWPITKEAAWGEATGSGVKVAIVDSGIDATHPAVGALAGSLSVELGEDGGVRFTEGPHDDLFGHGTACASIIRIAAPEAELYSVRVLGKTLKGKGTVFAAGLAWAIDHGMDVVNLSLSTSKRDLSGSFHELTDRAYFRNVMLVSAISNVPDVSIPSEYSSVFSVAAHDRTDPFGLDYNPSPPVEFGAPGIGVEVAWSGGGRTVATGNSFAAAHITGLIARILSKHPGLTPFQVKTILHTVADNAHPS